jgi:ABC-type siderophore export system fused ATPase/permease subunit
MLYLLSIAFLVCTLWIAVSICLRMWLSYRAYKFISEEFAAENDSNEYVETFYTQNSVGKYYKK